MASLDFVNKTVKLFSSINNEHLFDIHLSSIQRPYGVHLTSDGVLVTDYIGGKLNKYSLLPSDEPLWTFTGLHKPTGITTDESGFIYVAGLHSLEIHIIMPEGNKVYDIRVKQVTYVTVGFSITYYLHIRQVNYHCPLMVPPDLTQTE